MKIKHTMREIVDKTRAREKNTKQIFLLPLIPTVIFAIYAVFSNHNWDIAHIFLYPFAIAGLYIISVMGVLDVFFGYSIFQVLAPILNRKIKKIFNVPNRLERLEQESIAHAEELEELKSKNSIQLDPNLTKAMNEVAQAYKNLDFKKVGEIFTEIFQRLTDLENRNANQNNQFQCSKCRTLFLALPPDHIFNVAMREKCSVCDMLNMTMFKRERYDCEFCSELNHMYWHHKDLHTPDEIRRAEKLFYESE